MRVSVQRTGRPTRGRRSRGRAPPGTCADLAPKPPPTSGTITRTCAAVETVDLGQQRLRRVRTLAGRVVDEASVVGPVGGAGPALDRRRGQPLVDDPLLDDDLAPAEVGLAPATRSASRCSCRGRGRAGPRPAALPRGRRRRAAARSRRARGRPRPQRHAGLGDDGHDGLTDVADRADRQERTPHGVRGTPGWGAGRGRASRGRRR